MSSSRDTERRSASELVDGGSPFIAMVLPCATPVAFAVVFAVPAFDEYASLVELSVRLVPVAVVLPDESERVVVGFVDSDLAIS